MAKRLETLFSSPEQYKTGHLLIVPTLRQHTIGLQRDYRVLCI